VGWDASFEAAQRVQVAIVCDVTRRAAERDAAWQQLVGAVAPYFERWARQNRTLRRCRLDGDDEARAVMVAVLARLARRDFDNLRQFLARQPPEPLDVEEAELVESLARLTGPDGDDAQAPPAEVVATADDDGDVRSATPLRGWLVSLTRFAAKDHVKQRLGWNLAAAGARVATEVGPQRSKRDLSTDAERLDQVAEGGARPPVTDAMTMRAILVEIRGYLATLPAAMASALELWLDDHDFADIAVRVGLDDAAGARALVRAGQARLRGRFRDRWPELCAG
jgi:hypothetical protein